MPKTKGTSRPSARMKAAVLFLVCPCGYWEEAPADIEAELEDRPRMQGF